jgi:hypothetical protein
MMKTRAALYAFFVVSLMPFVVNVFGQERPSAFEDNLKTIGGELKVTELEKGCKFVVILNGKVVFRTDCQDESNKFNTEPIPHIHTYYKSIYEGIAPYDEVVLFQLGMLGNACNGGSLLFLGIREDGSFALSDPVDFCGGRQPVITWGGNKVTILIPGGAPNRGVGYIPSELWVYEKGVVKRAPAPKRGR